MGRLLLHATGHRGQVGSWHGTQPIVMAVLCCWWSFVFLLAFTCFLFLSLGQDKFGMRCAWVHCDSHRNLGHGNLQGALAISGSRWLVLCLHAGCLRPALCGVCPQDGPGYRRHRLAPWLRLCELPGEGSADEAPVCGGKRGSVFTILPPAWTPGQTPARPCLCCPGLSFPQDRQGQRLTGQASGSALVPGSWQGPRLTSARS